MIDGVHSRRFTHTRQLAHGTGHTREHWLKYWLLQQPVWLTYLFVCLLTKWLVGFIDWFVDWVKEWVILWLTDWPTDWLNVWCTGSYIWLINTHGLICILIDWMTKLQADFLIHWLLHDHVTDWLSNWISNWLINSHIDWHKIYRLTLLTKLQLDWLTFSLMVHELPDRITYRSSKRRDWLLYWFMNLLELSRWPTTEAQTWLSWCLILCMSSI